MPNLVPIVVEKEGNVERAYDIFSRLLKDRIIFIGTQIDDYVASLVIAQILFLSNEKRGQDINIYVNSPGGYVHSGLAIYDTMRFVPCDVSTTCIGMAASMGAVLLAAGTPGKRFILPNARVMIHQPAGGMQGTASDIEIHAEEMVKTKKQIIEILAEATGQKVEQVESDIERDKFLSAQEALEYGLVDELLSNAKPEPSKDD
ncbi:ATP-dependent Clp protease proteolytic subunit [bacterium]|nr:ATP-dependent Clp protease proteolytic subunit [bacterium]